MAKRGIAEENKVLAPRPVHPRAVRLHGLFGITYIRQHMVIDDRWTPGSLTEEFKGMTDLLTRRYQFKKVEANALRKRFITENHKLRRQCRDGRTKLQLCLSGANTLKIRNFLINHKDMQRLYQKMPVHLVVDNINQRTFVMRKERDRLRCRLEQLKSVYRRKLVERANIENRIKYENEFVLPEEVMSREFRKKIENSHVRLRAIKTINGAYKTMLQILLHDEIFYEPILRSLSSDIDDQAAFIKHILFLGTPAIANFKELSEQYRQMEEKSRKSMQSKLQMVANHKKMILKRPSLNKGKTEEAPPINFGLRYVRETPSMLQLKNELETIENTIKQIKFATLCSQAREIYPRMKAQVENNEKLHKLIENDTLTHLTLETKKNCAEVLQGVLINNLSEQEIMRLNRIKELEETLKEEDKFAKETTRYMKEHANYYVILRFTLWNLYEILRHVDRPAKGCHIQYPNSYLRLPLLKFEMLAMRACAPEVFEVNIDNVMSTIKRKVQRLMRAFKPDITQETMKEYKNEYHVLFLDSMETEDFNEGDEGAAGQQPPDEDDMLQEAKLNQNVPNRKQIKAMSAKLVEELSKKEEMTV